MSLKSNIYKILRLSNNLNAIRRGKIGQRIGRRVIGKVTGRMMRRIFK